MAAGSGNTLRYSFEASFFADSSTQVILSSFENVIHLSVNGIIFEDQSHLEIKAVPIQNSSYSGPFGLTLMAVDFSAYPSLSPGMDSRMSRQKAGTTTNIVRGSSDFFSVQEPLGVLETANSSQEIRQSSKTLTVTAYRQSEPLRFTHLPDELGSQSISIEGVSTDVLLDGSQLIKSRWQKLAPDVQNALIAVLASVILGLVGYGARRHEMLTAYVRSTLSPPTPPSPPIPLMPGTTVFQLVSGRRIAGNLLRVEGRVVKQYLISDVREWQEDHWSPEITAAVVKIPTDKVEMTFRNI